MKLQLRTWLAGLALCLFPTFAQAQHFINQCSHSPVPINAEVTTDEAARIAAANALAGITYCVPEETPLEADSEVAAECSQAEAATEAELGTQIDCQAGQESLDNPAAEVAVAEIEVIEAEAEVAEVEIAEVEAANTEMVAAAEAVEVAEIVASGGEAAEAEEVAPLGEDAAAEVAVVDEPESTLPAIEVVTEVVEQVEELVDGQPRAMPEVARLMDAPIICTLRDPEEYLPYDLTATDALEWQIFADGIPRPRRELQIPLAADTAMAEFAKEEPVTHELVEHEPAAEELFAQPTQPEASAAVEQPLVATELDKIDDGRIEPFASASTAAAVASAPEPAQSILDAALARQVGSLDCLLEDLKWRAGEALAEDGWLRTRLQPAHFGARLYSASYRAVDEAQSLLASLGEQLPAAAAAPALVGPPAPQADALAVEMAPAAEPAASVAAVEVAEPAESSLAVVIEDRRDTPTVCCPLEDFADVYEYSEAEEAFAAVETDRSEPAASELVQLDAPEVGDAVAEAGSDGDLGAALAAERLEEIDANLQAVLDFVRSISSPFQPRIANGGQETDTLAR